MRYVSIDIETTGLNPELDQILSFAAVVEDTESLPPVEELPKFTARIKHRRITGTAYALHLNAELIKSISESSTDCVASDVYDSAEEVVRNFKKFITPYLNHKGKIITAGKNAAGFDIPFLTKFSPQLIEVFDHRVLDPGSLFFDPRNDTILGLGRLKETLGLDPHVAHTAYEDALDVIRVLRMGYPK